MWQELEAWIADVAFVVGLALILLSVFLQA